MDQLKILEKIREIDNQIYTPKRDVSRNKLTESTLDDEVYRCKKIQDKLNEILNSKRSLKEWIIEKSKIQPPTETHHSVYQKVIVPNPRYKKNQFYLYDLNHLDVSLLSIEEQYYVDDTEDIALNLILNAIFTLSNKANLTYKISDPNFILFTLLKEQSFEFLNYSKLLVQLLFPEKLAPFIYKKELHKQIKHSEQRKDIDYSMQNYIFKWLLITFSIIDFPKQSLINTGKKSSDATREALLEYLNTKDLKHLKKKKSDEVVTESSFSRAMNQFSSIY